MQHQEIALRKSVMQLLTRAEKLCQSWDVYQSKTLNLLHTVHNLDQQRALTLDNATDKLQHTLLIDEPHFLFKQTCRYESALKQLDVFFKSTWQALMDDWEKLEHEANHTFIKFNASCPPTSKPVPLSSQALIQVASVSPSQAQQWIQTLKSHYASQFHTKRMLLLDLTASEHPMPLDTLLTQWSHQSYLHHLSLPTLLSERILLYKQIKAAIEAA
ncbi:hypothetical protein DM01DRAFT_1403930 [Hesseltinella vesiculosa]|uniref:Uncharacterized protein n=1 Tax=Hesseltinella vesiculosa TaxID=101127 RepID=A0A1X2GW70_9FUNG|nr:hypothetical protein DM01DRAFT_1403930 [Hesseltinella vesiculosa]